MGPALPGLPAPGIWPKLGYEVTIFEALHEPGGVLLYGIPEFRLPKEGVVMPEIENVKKLGVKIETNVIIGKSVTIDELLEEEGFEAVFIGSGAGLPMFMGIPGENANGVFSANEYLTRSNLMKAFRDDHDTPIAAGKKVAVVGGGNVAMDAARTALRLGADVHIVYRRSEAELPARVEEVHHAKEEGIIFDLLTNPTEILVDDNGWVKGMRCIRMELGEPDASGRRRPVPVEGSEFVIDVDTVIMSLGTSPNPLISSTTKGLEVNKRKCIVAEETSGKTSKEGVYAGGDAVTGAATVILAMEAGRAGARGIDEFLRKPHKERDCHEKYKRIFTIVIDSLGVGAMPDAAEYDDVGTDTLGHIDDCMDPFVIPNLARMGLANLHPLKHVKAVDKPLGYFGRLLEASTGKDTMTGHWEMMGLHITKPFQTFTETGFPKELLDELSARTGHKIVGNKSASGTEILDERGRA